MENQKGFSWLLSGAFLKHPSLHLLKESKDAGMETAYVITDYDDTAKMMCTKYGFTGISQKYELFFKI